MNKVAVNKKAQKQLKKLSNHIVMKLRKWAEDVEEFGIKEIRLIPGYNDELLQGKRAGQRSIRLSKAYRGIYIEYKKTVTIKVIEVNKHEY